VICVSSLNQLIATYVNFNVISFLINMDDWQLPTGRKNKGVSDILCTIYASVDI
jgi:hypothetical protein